MRKSPGDIDHAEALVDAERQMTDHQVDLFDRLIEGVAPYVPKGLSAAESGHLIDGLIEASPELREIAQRLEILKRLGRLSEPDPQLDLERQLRGVVYGPGCPTQS